MTQKLKRYGGGMDEDSDFIIVERPDGEFVKFEDYQKIQAQLAKAEEVIKFYSDEKNWANLTSIIYANGHLSKSYFIQDDYGEYNHLNVRSQGERAREYFKEKEQV